MGNKDRVYKKLIEGSKTAKTLSKQLRLPIGDIYQYLYRLRKEKKVTNEFFKINGCVIYCITPNESETEKQKKASKYNNLQRIHSETLRQLYFMIFNEVNRDPIDTLFLELRNFFNKNLIKISKKYYIKKGDDN